MPAYPANVYQLLNGMLEEGLPYVASYIEKLCKYKIIICDDTGKIHYPDLQENNILPNFYVKLPPETNEEDYYYHRTDKRLYFHIGKSPASTYIIVNGIPSDQVSHAILLLNADIKLAVKYYFANLEAIHKDKQKTKRDLIEFLIPDHENIRTLLALHVDGLDIFRPYFFSIMEADSANPEIDWQRVRSYSEQYLKSNLVDSIQIPCSQNVVMGMIPASIKKDDYEVDSQWFMKNAIDHQKAVESRFNFTTSVGEGKIYPLSEIYKSYFEASISMNLPKLMGKKHFIKRFSELGIFELIYSNDSKTLKNFYHNTLGKLIDYDEANDGMLLPTLRLLLDSSFNWKNVAKQMFVHVNTLHYRVKKAEQLMQMDLSQMGNRVNTFLAIKIYDMLRFQEEE